jgi:hypothetical protein
MCKTPGFKPKVMDSMQDKSLFAALYAIIYALFLNMLCVPAGINIPWLSLRFLCMSSAPLGVLAENLGLLDSPGVL